MIELAEIVAGWPLGISIAAAAAAHGVRLGRRRVAVNEALHELRRPLQAIALASGHEAGSTGVVKSSVRLAAAALERLEREVNGEPTWHGGRPVELHGIAEATVRRWRARASLGGGSLSLRWWAGRVQVEGNAVALAQALDNLVVNAIEHGGPAVIVEARRRGGSVLISVSDSGRFSRSESRRDTPAETIARLAGRGRRGHGLAVVRKTASAHGGRFVLRCSEQGTVAVLELPLAGESDEIAA